MVVVDEVRIAVVDPLVIRHMGIGRMDANALGDDLVQRPAGAHQIIEHLAGADLVARQNAVLQPGIEPRRVATRCGVRVHVHAECFPDASWTATATAS